MVTSCGFRHIGIVKEPKSIEKCPKIPKKKLSGYTCLILEEQLDKSVMSKLYFLFFLRVARNSQDDNKDQCGMKIPRH